MQRKGMPQHHYSDEEKAFLKKYSAKLTRQQLTEQFNDRFGTRQSVQAITSICCALGYKSGNNGKFKKGQKPWCKGIKKQEWLSHMSTEGLEGIKKGQFGYGRKRNSGYPIGYELWRNGYLMVKISNDKNLPFRRRWKPKQVLIWEQYYKKKVPDGCIVIFKDGNNTNFEISNLLLIQRDQSAVLSTWNGFNKGNLTELYAQAAKLLVLSNKKAR